MQMNKLARPLGLALMVSAIGLAAIPLPTTAAAAGNQAKGRAVPTNSAYIIQLADMPVTAYRGDIKGYAATKPRKGQKIDPNAIKGGPLHGLKGVVVKSHGGATSGGFGSAIRVAVELARSDYMEKVGANLQRLTALLESPIVNSAEVPAGESIQ